MQKYEFTFRKAKNMRFFAFAKAKKQPTCQTEAEKFAEIVESQCFFPALTTFIAMKNAQGGLCVHIHGTYAYRRSDGVLVVPLSCLKD